MASITRTKAIMEFFGAGSRPVGFSEVKALTREDRIELGDACAKELGFEVEEPK